MPATAALACPAPASGSMGDVMDALSGADPPEAAPPGAEGTLEQALSGGL